jgi:hypothetical protein
MLGRLTIAGLAALLVGAPNAHALSLAQGRDAILRAAEREATTESNASGLPNWQVWVGGTDMEKIGDCHHVGVKVRCSVRIRLTGPGARPERGRGHGVATSPRRAYVVIGYVR